MISFQDPESESVSFYHYYPGVPALVGSRAADGSPNFMPAIWTTALSYDPPLFGVAVSRKRHSHECIASAGAFSVSFHDSSFTATLAELGKLTGHHGDKVSRCDVSLHWGKLERVPFALPLYAGYEMALDRVVETGDHDLFIGRIVGVWRDADLLDSFDRPSPERVSPILYFGKNRYGRPDAYVRDL